MFDELTQAIKDGKVIYTYTDTSEFEDDMWIGSSSVFTYSYLSNMDAGSKIIGLSYTDDDGYHTKCYIRKEERADILGEPTVLRFFNPIVVSSEETLKQFSGNPGDIGLIYDEPTYRYEFSDNSIVLLDSDSLVISSYTVIDSIEYSGGFYLAVNNKALDKVVILKYQGGNEYKQVAVSTLTMTTGNIFICGGYIYVTNGRTILIKFNSSTNEIEDHFVTDIFNTGMQDGIYTDGENIIGVSYLNGISIYNNGEAVDVTYDSSVYNGNTISYSEYDKDSNSLLLCSNKLDGLYMYRFDMSTGKLGTGGMVFEALSNIKNIYLEVRGYIYSSISLILQIEYTDSSTHRSLGLVNYNIDTEGADNVYFELLDSRFEGSSTLKMYSLFRTLGKISVFMYNGKQMIVTFDCTGYGTYWDEDRITGGAYAIYRDIKIDNKYGLITTSGKGSLYNENIERAFVNIGNTAGKNWREILLK